MGKLAVTRIVHSCHLIEIGSRTFLTDPWFSTKPGYYPGEPPALNVGDLPALDGVLISHAHYDHCDLDAFSAYRGRDVPLFGPSTVVAEARKHGFDNVAQVEAWDAVDVGGVTLTATPARHGVHEITFVLRAGSEAVYFGGDTLYIPELDAIPTRLGPITLALLPINGLQIRPLANMQVVMNAVQAAQLTASLKPIVALPHHYAFTSGWLGDRLITSSDRDPRHFVEAAARVAPATTIQVVGPGVPVDL
jgi:L-ascorbate metabolism protein UlaG (beta-lactamase superfamily)